MELHSRTHNLDIDGELHVDVNTIFSSVSALHKQISGGYACVSLISGLGILAFRDPNGIRPLIFGSREIEGETEWIVASESVAIHALGFEVVRDVKSQAKRFSSPQQDNSFHSNALKKLTTLLVSSSMYTSPDQIRLSMVFLCTKPD